MKYKEKKKMNQYYWKIKSYYSLAINDKYISFTLTFRPLEVGMDARWGCNGYALFS